MRVMIDTNVLLSGLIFHSRNMRKVMQIASNDTNVLLLSTFGIDEAREVVERKWPDRVGDLEFYLLELNFETIVTPLHLKLGLFDIRDSNDYPILYSAIMGAADVLVTGDKDFDDVQVETPKIMTPTQFLDEYAAE